MKSACEHSSARRARAQLRALTASAAHRDAEPAIRCRGLAKTFGSGEIAVQALRGVDLEVMPGSDHALGRALGLRQDDADLDHRRPA